MGCTPSKPRRSDIAATISTRSTATCNLLLNAPADQTLSTRNAAVEGTVVAAPDTGTAASLAHLALQLTRFGVARLPDGRVVTVDVAASRVAAPSTVEEISHYNMLLRLADEASFEGVVTLPRDGRIMTKTQLYVEAIRFNPRKHAAYCRLASTLSPWDAVRFHDGRQLSRQQLLLEAIRRNNGDAEAFDSLADCSEHPVVTLSDGRVMSICSLLIEAIRLDPRRFDPYSKLARSLPAGESVTLHGLSNASRQDVLFEAWMRSSHTGLALVMLSASLGAGGSIVLPDGRTMSQYKLLMEAIHYEGYSELVLNGLSFFVDDSPEILRAGRKLTRRELLLEAIHKFPPAPGSLAALAGTLMPAESVTLLDGQVLDRLQLHLLSVRRCPRSAECLCGLANAIGKEKRVTLHDGRDMTQRELFLEALTLPGRVEDTMVALATSMDRHETIMLPCGRRMDKIQLTVEALKRNSQSSAGYSALAKALHGPAIRVTLSDGRVLNKRQLLMTAAALAWNPSVEFNLLADDMDDTETVSIGNRAMSRRQLHMEAIRLEPSFSRGYVGLAASLKPFETITLYDGRAMGRQQLLLEAIRRNACDAHAFWALAKCIAANAKVTLHTGRMMDKGQLVSRAMYHASKAFTA
jgi:hypothetical protein